MEVYIVVKHSFYDDEEMKLNSAFSDAIKADSEGGHYDIEILQIIN